MRASLASYQEARRQFQGFPGFLSQPSCGVDARRFRFGALPEDGEVPMLDLRTTALAAAAAGFLIAGALSQHAAAQGRGGSTSQSGAAAAAAARASSLSPGGLTSGGTLASPRPSPVPTPSV